MGSIRRTRRQAGRARRSGLGERVYRSGSGQTAHTVFDPGGRWIGDYDEYGQTIQQAIWLGELPVGLMARVEGQSNKLFYLQPDALGTPRVVIDSTRGAKGTAVWRWDLQNEAFGEEMPNEDPDNDGTAFVLDMRFPGQQYYSATGLNYNYFRDYDPSMGRYVQSDPIGLEGGINTYSYVGGNPLTRTDPFGLADPTLELYASGVINRMPERSINVRGPDYVRVSVNAYIFNFSILRARNGKVYGSGGFARPYPHPMSAGVSASLGWQNQCEKPDSGKLDRFHTGPGTSVIGGYYELGGAIGYSPGEGTSTEVGVGLGVTMAGSAATGGVAADGGVVLWNDGWG